MAGGIGREEAMAQEHYQTPSVIAPARYVHWSAVWAGGIVAFAIQMMLGLLGAGIGLSAVNLASSGGGNPGAGSVIWGLLTMIISLYVGGWVAGHEAGIPRRADGAMHGFVAWSLAMVVTFFLVTTTLGRVVGGAAGLAGAAAPQMAQSGGPQGQAGVQPQGGGETQPNLPPSVGKPNLEQLGTSAAKGLGAAFIWLFIGEALGAVAAALGGRVGAPQQRYSSTTA